MRKERLFGAFALVLALSVARAPRAAPERVVERILAVVDGEPILASEIARRARARERALDAISMPDWRRAALRYELWRAEIERLVEERLIARAARERGIDVTPAEVERTLAVIARDNQLTPSELVVALEAYGMTLAEYRHELRAQLLARRTLEAWLRDEHRSATTLEAWERERKRWLAELRRQSFIERRWSR